MRWEKGTPQIENLHIIWDQTLVITCVLYYGNTCAGRKVPDVKRTQMIFVQIFELLTEVCMDLPLVIKPLRYFR